MTASATPPMPVKVFFSYSHRDKRLMEELERHLASLRVQKIVSVWHDRKILGGENWETAISEEINTSEIILLLITANFIASTYCYGIEMIRAMERHHAGEARVIPIILRDCVWEDLPFAELQALPENGKPVDKWKSRDEALANIVRTIRRIVLSRPDTGLPYPEGSLRERVPEYVPYLCDRSREEARIKDELFDLDDKRLRRPCICIVHGDELECHDMFYVQLKRKPFQYFFGRHNVDLLQEHLMDFPPIYEGEEKALDSFRASLAELILNDRTASNETIGEKLSSMRSLIVIRSYLRTEDWGMSGRLLIDSFIRYWNEFPDLASGVYLINCLFFTYKTVGEPVTPSLQKLLAFNSDARRFFENLDFARYSRVCGLTLRELESVGIGEVENWIRNDKSFPGLCLIHSPEFCRTQKALQEVRDIFSNMMGERYIEGIPMQHLAPKLGKLLERNLC